MSEAQVNGASGAPAAHLAAAWQASSSRCIKCGFCLPACPTYRETGLEPASPRGRLDLMYAAAQGRLDVRQIAGQISACLGCLACETACPSGIRYRDMLEAAQVDLAARRPGRWWRRLLLNQVVARPLALRTVAWTLAIYQRSGLQWLVARSRLLALVAPGLAEREARMPPLPLPRPWRRRSMTGGDVAGEPAVLFTGCVMDVLFGAAHAATLEVLRANGFAPRVPTGQGCCGALHAHAGEWDDARELARRNIAAFEAHAQGALVVNSAGCGAFLKQYADLFPDGCDWRRRARTLAARVQDPSQTLSTRPLRPPAREVRLRVAYDDPCHLIHAQGISEEPRALLAQIPGLDVVPLPEAGWCCGSAGTYSLAQPELSAQVLDRKMRHIRRCHVDAVVTGNPGCLLQLALGARERGLPLRVLHPMELLAMAYRR